MRLALALYRDAYVPRMFWRRRRTCCACLALANVPQSAGSDTGFLGQALGLWSSQSVGSGICILDADSGGGSPARGWARAPRKGNHATSGG